MEVNTSPTNSRVKEPPVNKEVITISQEVRFLEDIKKDLADIQFKLYKTRFTELWGLIDDAFSQCDREIIGAEDRRNERT